MFRVEFPQVQYIDLSKLIHVLKAVAIVTTEHLLITLRHTLMYRQQQQLKYKTLHAPLIDHSATDVALTEKLLRRELYRF